MQEQAPLGVRPSFGSRLHAYRTGRGTSLQALADLVHYSKGHLSKIENGEKPASAQLARSCDEVLGAGNELVLAHRRAEEDRPRARPQRPAQLPMAPVPFVGRAGQLAALDAAYDRLHTRGGEAAGVVVVDGMAGVGKTALMLQWAHRAAERFPGGILFYDLLPRGVPVSSAQVPAGFLQALGVRADDLPHGTAERAALYRTLLARRRVLVVLDNAVSAGQVRPQLPGSPGSMVLVGSRDRLPGLIARDGATRVPLTPLSTGESCELLRQVAGRRQAAVGPARTAEVVGRCGRLPLALRIAAETLPTGEDGRAHWSADAGAWLDLLSAGGDEVASVRAAFERSYRALEEEAARAFRLLGAHAEAGISLAAAAVLLDTDEAGAWRLLDALYQVHLTDQPTPGRYRVHCLLRAYAAELAAEDRQVSEEGSRRLLEWYRRTAQEALRTLLGADREEAAGATAEAGGPDGTAPLEQAWRWCEAEESNLRLAVEQADRLDMGVQSAELSDVTALLDLLRHGEYRAPGRPEEAGRIPFTPVC